jgi:hypothetical protein
MDPEGMIGSSANMVSVVDLTGPSEGTPDRRFTLTAQQKTITLALANPWMLGHTTGKFRDLSCSRRLPSIHFNTGARLLF